MSDSRSASGAAGGLDDGLVVDVGIELGELFEEDVELLGQQFGLGSGDARDLVELDQRLEEALRLPNLLDAGPAQPFDHDPNVPVGQLQALHDVGHRPHSVDLVGGGVVLGGVLLGGPERSSCRSAEPSPERARKKRAR